MVAPSSSPPRLIDLIHMIMHLHGDDYNERPPPRLLPRLALDEDEATMSGPLLS